MSTTVATPPFRTPPDEQSWKRYSPHYELPISSASSVLLHALLLLVLLFGGIIATRVGAGSGNGRSLQVETVVVPGGGSPQSGIETGKDLGSLSDGKERTSSEPETSKLAAGRPSENLKEVRPKDELLLEKDPSAASRTVEAATSTLGILSATSENAKKRLDGVIARTGTGKPGPSHLGSPGTHGVKPAPDRKSRQLRWTLIFNTRYGGDYLKQLDSLGAFLVIPKDDQFLVVRDLKRRPVELKAEDLSTLDRIYWIDDRPESVRSLTRALGLSFTPGHVAAFFPTELEKAMAERELDYLRRTTRKSTEDDINETHFRVEKQGKGYAPRVVSQSLKR